ncbi:hypothetical protein HKD24_06570 [Gluconobacter sp. LMG 31484]|uniref:Alpha/beta hydrolase n=1 Tax=Gluconobacter vitians TaxID=2728102 RepID=A0ABR9Y4U2_9PROT|nr:hypothetical protein [Gluconobacter vitians]MBF0858877.1 hypothetical protein [Gluconobacter vitians]
MEGKELVLHFHEGNTKYCVLTFPARLETQHARNTFFGESIFKKYNISSIGLTTKVDNWYICDEMDGFIQKIKTITEKYNKIVAIGPSMGSYPAIKYSKILNVHRILALAPKWTIDPDLINLEDDNTRKGLLSGNMHDIINRVYTEDKKGHCIEENDVEDNLIVCYDQHSELDRSNIEKLRTVINFEEVLFPYCGHEIIQQLKGSENIKNIVHSMVCDDIKTTCRLLSKIRRSHKTKISRYYDVAQERHPVYCFLMLKKFIDGKLPGYKDFLFRQHFFSGLMDKSIRKKMPWAAKDVEFYFRNKLISKASENRHLSTEPSYRSDVFNITDYHGGRLEYSLRDETLFASNYFFGSRDFAINVFAKKIRSEIFLVTIFDGQTFYLHFKDGKILLSNFAENVSLLKLSPTSPPQQNDFFYDNNFMKDIFRVVTPQGYMMSMPNGHIVFNSSNTLAWESFTLHAPLDERAPVQTRNIQKDVKLAISEKPKKKAGLFSRLISSK